MLPLPVDLDREVREAEAEVDRADAQVRVSVGVLRQRFLDRLPWLVGAGIGVAIYLLLPRSRRAVPATRGFIGRSPWSRLAAPLVNLLISRGVGLLTAVVAAMVARKPAKPLATVPHVDLDRYAGMWFEIARLPTRAEDRCERDVTATYEVMDSGLRVINRCRRADGRIKSAVGRARVVGDRTNARLQVSFAPSFLDALPFVWGDYWILDLADDYDAAMVGTPDRKHLWLLSRTPSLAWNRTQRIHRARRSARIRHGQIGVHRANGASRAACAGAPDQRRRPSFASRAARDRRRVARRIGTQWQWYGAC